MQFPPFRIWQRVSAIRSHSAAAAPNKYSYRLVGTAAGVTGTLGYYSNDGWKFHVTWDDEPDLTAVYPFSDWMKLVGPIDRADGAASKVWDLPSYADTRGL